MRQREYLFLQGLAGPFFSMLGERLRAHGHGVTRINFNGGDKFYWRGAGAIDYRWGLKRWPNFLLHTLQQRRITDLVLFGDCRPLHAAAVEVARRSNVQVHVFEEGYIRPDFVTVEAGGVNGNSTLWRDAEPYLATARELGPLPPLPVVPSSFKRRAREDVSYNVASLALAPLFPGYRTHRPWHILVEYAGWALRLARTGREQRRSDEAMAALKADGRPYFAFPLQLDDDYQIRVHSPFGGMQPAVEHVLRSFAAHAPKDVVLLVKGHPLDNGLTDWEKRTRQVAARLGITDRLHYVAAADIEDVVREARGVVTVNSTTGTLALRHGVPTIVLGDAVYDVPRITHQAGIDRFWTAPQAPEARVFDAFRRVLMDRCLVHGGYFSEEGLEMLVTGAASRLERAPSGMAPLVQPAAAGVRPSRFGDPLAAE